MKEHIVVVDEGHPDDLNQLQNIDNTKESIEILADSFVAVAEKNENIGRCFTWWISRHSWPSVKQTQKRKNIQRECFKP